MRSDDIDSVLRATQQLQDVFQQKLASNDGPVNDRIQAHMRRILQATADLMQQIDDSDDAKPEPTFTPASSAMAPAHWQLTQAPRRPHARYMMGAALLHCTFVSDRSRPAPSASMPLSSGLRHPQVQLPVSTQQAVAVGPNGEAKQCNCKKSLCLKLYCECFAAGGFCGPHCACVNCNNAPGHEQQIQQAKIQILARSPAAFEPKLHGDRQHKKGCRCRKTRCLKKYCECFQAGVPCGEACRCESCNNVDPNTGLGGGAPGMRPVAMPPPMLHGMRAQSTRLHVSPRRTTGKSPLSMAAMQWPGCDVTPVGMQPAPFDERFAVREDSLRLTEAESAAPLVRASTPRAAQRPIITVEGNGVMPTLHLVGTTVYAVTPVPRAAPEARDEEVCDDATSPPPAVLTKRGTSRTASVKKPRIRSLADIPPLAFDEHPSATQGSNDSGESTPPETDADDPGTATWGRKRGRGARRPATSFDDVGTGDTTTLKPIAPSLFNITSPPRHMANCEDFRSPPYDKSAARIPQFLHHTVQPKSHKRKSGNAGFTAVLASRYGTGLASGDKRVNRDLYLDEMAALDLCGGKENATGGRCEAERDAVDALCTLSNNNTINA